MGTFQCDSSMLSSPSSSSSSSPSSLQHFSTISLSPWTGGEECPYPWVRELKSEERGLYLIHLLLTSANHVAAGNLEKANTGLEQLSHLASPEGDTMQRIVSYFTEALAERVLKTWPGLHRALNATRVSLLSEEIMVRRIFYELCPFLKLAYVITNQAILEAMEGEKMIHIIDLDSSQPAQWTPLLQEFSRRREGTPHLRITGVHPRKEMLEQTCQSLVQEAENLDIPFQFCMVQGKVEKVKMEKLRVKTGEALVVCSVLKLHPLLALGGKSSSCSFLERFLREVRGVSPKLTVVIEKEGNHNGEGVMERVVEALHYYAAMFDSLEWSGGKMAAAAAAGERRVRVEKMVYGEEIKNIVACEGEERRERHERLGRWVERMKKAGFFNQPLSYSGLVQARQLLLVHGGGGGYGVKEEEGGCAVICWQDRPLFSVSAWRCTNNNGASSLLV